ncbi:UNVERIFIED_CONTAM: hypothetical protein RMT77_006840 [Armadillidium vulgare]
MWILSGIDDGSYFNLLCDSSSIVSREGPGHIILHDKSVSKAHASFCLTYHDRHLSHPEILPEVLLRDLQSTNGTYIRSESSDYKKLDPDTPVTLKQGDIIRFGRNKKFRLKYQPFIITSSQITNKNVKEQLKECVRCLGGHLVKEWIPDCSLLIMNDLFITAKTVCALAAGANIVTPAYLIDMKTAIKEKKPLPDIKKYLPVLKEPSIRSTEVSFYPNLSRKKLFIGKTFFFQNEGSLNRMKQSVVEAGGTPVLVSENNYPDIINNNSVFIKAASANEMPNYVSKCYELLKANKLHPIPESDIGLAVVYNSIEKYCSPKFRMSGILQPNSSMSQCPSLKMEVYATETQHETESLPTTLPSRTTIPESGGSSGRSNIVASSKANEPQCKTDIEKNSIGEMNKENIGRRKRSFADSTSPNEKVSESKSKKANLSKISNDTVETIVDDEVDNTINFQPSQFSTQKLSPVNCKKRKSDEFAVPESTVVRKNVRLATPQKVITEMHEESLEISSISKSIPFEPYTLPSINIANMEEEEPSVADEEEKETQIFSGGVKDIKKEPVSQGKIHQIEETPEGNVLDDGWIKAVSTKPPSQNREEADRAKSSFLKPNPVPLVNETLSKEENEFALSFSSKKRKGRLFSSSHEVNPEQSSVSKRTRMEQESESNVSKLRASKTIKKSLSVVEAEMNDNGRDSHPLHLVPEEVEEKPFLSTQKVKKEPNIDKDISDLAETMERSYMIVEVVDFLIVKKKEVEESFNTEESNCGLPNYKAFVKVWPNTSSETCLPRIIGGSDLVSSVDKSFRRESFLASQPPLPDHFVRREREAEEFRKELEGGTCETSNRIGPNRNIDSDFRLLTRTGRRKGRL